MRIQDRSAGASGGRETHTEDCLKGMPNEAGSRDVRSIAIQAFDRDEAFSLTGENAFRDIWRCPDRRLRPAWNVVNACGTAR